MTISPKYLDTEGAAIYLGFPSAQALRVAARKHGIPHIKIGTALRFEVVELDKFMKVMAKRTAA